MNGTHDMALANNKYYTLAVVLVIYWLATFISLKGMSWVGKVAKIGGMVGTIIPAGLLIILAIIYLTSGGHSNLDFNSSFIPDFSNFDNYFKYIHSSWLSPIIAVALAFGILPGVLTWVAGPSKGIFSVGRASYLPPFFKRLTQLAYRKTSFILKVVPLQF